MGMGMGMCMERASELESKFGCKAILNAVRRLSTVKRRGNAV